MKILVVGAGGREHALCWKIARSPLVTRLYCAPGNPGTALVADNVPVAADDLAGLARFAKQEGIDLTVVGPEGPLCAGIVDVFAKEGLLCFGPNKAAAEIEGDKAFARELCRRHRIPGPAFWVFEDHQLAKSFLDNREDGPIVVKAAGLAAGKGVTVCKNSAEAKVAVAECLEQRRFGEAGNRVVFEECLEGPEVSLITLTDGHTIVPLEPARDHKRVFDGDKGPNTGGMGAFAPSPLYTEEIAERTEREILLPTLHAMNAEGFTFKGVLYVGLMLTAEGPKVVEYNARFGDPETQVVLPLLESDLFAIMRAVREQRLAETEIRWRGGAAACIVLASGGYPGKYESGKAITGLADAEAAGATVYHAGTKRTDAGYVTAGGRVLGVTALGDTLAEAIRRAYAAAEKIHFEGAHMRRDIGIRDTERA